LIENQGDRSKPDPVAKERNSSWRITQEYMVMLCEFGEILLNVAASCEQTITSRITGEITTLIDNQGDRSKPADPVTR
jgi:hypothetical protein